MKKFCRLLIFTGAILLIGGSALAFPVIIGEVIEFNRTYGSTSGGQFDVVRDGGSTTVLKTFCLEMNEHINLTGDFKVGGISSAAKNGGQGGAENGQDPLAETTKWLYWHFAIGDLQALSNDVYQYDTHAGADLLQKAFWQLENEGIFRSAGNDVDLLIKSAEQALIATNGIFTEGRVAVINLEYLDGRRAQDQLVAAPVPEPGTLLLLGSGLIGATLLHRRKKR